jgi:hypothetical protein
MDSEDKAARCKELVKGGVGYMALGKQKFDWSWWKDCGSNSGFVITEEWEVSSGSGGRNMENAISHWGVFMSVCWYHMGLAWSLRSKQALWMEMGSFMGSWCLSATAEMSTRTIKQEIARIRGARVNEVLMNVVRVGTGVGVKVIKIVGNGSIRWRRRCQKNRVRVGIGIQQNVWWGKNGKSNGKDGIDAVSLIECVIVTQQFIDWWDGKVIGSDWVIIDKVWWERGSKWYSRR